MSTPKAPRTPLQEYAINIMMTPPPKTPFIEEEGSFCAFPFSLPFKTKNNKESETHGREISKLKLENHQLNLKITTLTEDLEFFKRQFEEFKYAVVESVSDLEIGFEKKRIYDFKLFETLIEQKQTLINTPPLITHLEDKVIKHSKKDQVESILLFSFLVFLLSVVSLFLIK